MSVRHSRSLAARAAKVAFDSKGQPQPFLYRLIESGIDKQRGAVHLLVKKLRQRHPDLSPTELSDRVDRYYIRLVTTAGTASGSTAFVPGVGTFVGLGVSAATTVAFMESTALYALALAEIHGLHVEDPGRAKATVMALALGDEGLSLVRSFASQAAGKGRPMPAWGVSVGKALPASAVRLLNTRLRDAFMRRLLASQTKATFGRVLPFGVGAAVGAFGNRRMARTVVQAARRAFGPAAVEGSGG